MDTASSASHRTRIVTGLRATFESLGWIAMEVGIFKRLGLECTFPRLETGGPEAVAGVVRGEWEFAETGSAPFVQAALDGRDTTILLAALAPLPTGLPILTRPAISDPHQLEGKRLGVLTDAGQVAISVRSALRMWGVRATLVPLGTFGAIYAALGSGEIDAGAFSADYRFLGPREFGLRVLDTPEPRARARRCRMLTPAHRGGPPPRCQSSPGLRRGDPLLQDEAFGGGSHTPAVPHVQRPHRGRGSLRVLCASPSAIAATVGGRSPDSSPGSTAEPAVRRSPLANRRGRFVAP